MPIITIQFKGICCHIEGGPPQRRSVLPIVHQHVPYIEVYANDVDTAANPQFSFTLPYQRYNASYRHVVVNDSKIELLNVTSTSFNLRPSYDERIPKLSKVEPRFTGVKLALLQPVIASGNVAAYFDIAVGDLSSGVPEHHRTFFDPENQWPLRHLGQWAQLDVEVSGAAPSLRVTSLADGSVRDLVLRDGATGISIGNQTLLDISGSPNLTGHFEHFYELADPPLVPPPLLPVPKPGLGLGIGCSNTNFP